MGFRRPTLRRPHLVLLLPLSLANCARYEETCALASAPTAAAPAPPPSSRSQAPAATAASTTTWAAEAARRSPPSEDVVRLEIRAAACWDIELGDAEPEMFLDGFPALSDDGHRVAIAFAGEAEYDVAIVDDHGHVIDHQSLHLPPALAPGASFRCFEPGERQRAARYAAAKRHYDAVAARLNAHAKSWRRLSTFETFWYPPLRSGAVGPSARQFCTEAECVEAVRDASGATFTLSIRPARAIGLALGAEGLAIVARGPAERTLRVPRLTSACSTKPSCSADVDLEPIGFSRRRGRTVAIEARASECRDTCWGVPRVHFVELGP